MEPKYLVSHLPCLMRARGIKNTTELSVLSGISVGELKQFIKDPQLDFDLINQLIEFFKCRQTSLVLLENKHFDYTFWIESKPEHSGIVYFLKADNGLTKIGWTANLEKRKEAIEYNEQIKTKLIHHISSFDCPTLEKTLHKVFAQKRVTGEWFDLTDEDIEIFKS